MNPRMITDAKDVETGQAWCTACGRKHVSFEAAQRCCAGGKCDYCAENVEPLHGTYHKSCLENHEWKTSEKLEVWYGPVYAGLGTGELTAINMRNFVQCWLKDYPSIELPKFAFCSPAYTAPEREYLGSDSSRIAPRKMVRVPKLGEAGL